MIFPGDRGVVTSSPQKRWKLDEVPRQRSMEFARAPVVVWKPPRDDAAATRAAATCRQVGVVKSTSIRCECIDVGRSSRLAAIASVVIPADIISDEENDVWLLGCKQDGR